MKNRVLAACLLSALGLGFCALDLSVALESSANANRPVAKELKAMSDGVAEKAPEAANIFADGIASVAASGIVDKAPKVGDKVLAFELPDASGKRVKLAELLSRGPVVLTWYRGGWCPYCNIGLRGLLKVEPQIKELGATLVAITPETPDSASETMKSNSLSFVVLSDQGNLTAQKYKIAYTVPAESLTMMKAFKVDLEKSNGDQSGQLPLAATYVIDQKGVIRWSFVDADYRKRAEPSDVIAALEKMKK